MKSGRRWVSVHQDGCASSKFLSQGTCRVSLCLFHDVEHNFILTRAKYSLQSAAGQSKALDSSRLWNKASGGAMPPATATLLRHSAAGKPERDRGSSKSLQKALRILLYMGGRAPDVGVMQLAPELCFTE